jgi:ATP-dependent RNA helicase DeaD
MTDTPEFSTLGLRPELLQAITELGYEEATPIQAEAIPPILAGRDLVGQAATGTGKTAAFALPALQLIDTSAPAKPVALVLVPTRELAMQVSEAFFRYGRELHAKALPIYGGQPIYRQLQALDRGVHVVIATPGRALDHIGRGSLPLDSVKLVVLDEADEMLDMGFADDIEAILDATPEHRQTVLFSATMPPRINAIARKHQRDPVRINVSRGEQQDLPSKVRQSVYVVQRTHKPAALGRILDIESPKGTIVFCRTRTEVDQLTETMNGRGYRAEALHGGMDQAQRDRVMGRLRDGTAELLVATDVAARGLDVDSLTHVVNYDVPSAPESYVHRIGRVGRAGREGVAITLAEPREQRLLANIERLTKQTIEVQKVPTIADLRARQIEATVVSIREALADDHLDDYHEVLNALNGDDNMRAIALAAIKLVHEASTGDMEEAEIPDASHRIDRGARHDGKPGKGGKQGAGGRKGQQPSGETGFIYLGFGRKFGLRPGDIVGAIANETNLVGREIGPIKITEKFAIVGVPERSVDNVIATLKTTSIRGKKPVVRRYAP